MSIVLSLRFLSGRYHATPWDRHPNEGATEWPPSPWRLLRALVAAAFRADGTPDRDVLCRVVGALSETPVFRTPAATTAHTRSFLPQYKEGDTAMVLDAFVVVGLGGGDESANVEIEWRDAQLDESDLLALDRWLESLGYLGRAESWVEGRRVTRGAFAPNVAPMEPTDFAAHSARVLAPRHSPDVVTSSELLAALCQDTSMLFKDGLSEPRCSRWQSYRFDTDPFLTSGRREESRRVVVPTLVRLAVSGRVRPRLTEVVRFGDRVRAALMSRSRGADGLPHPVFSGKTSDGLPLRDNAHAHVLPVDDDRDGVIDHLVLWAPGGFDRRALSAISEFDWLWGDDGWDLRITFVGAAASGADPAVLGIGRASARTAVTATAQQWQSRTPFVLPRHPKLRRGVWTDTPEDQLRRECERANLPPIVSIRSLDGTDAPNRLLWHRFRLARTHGGGSRGGDRGYGFSIEFERAASGPIALGYGARQGLGQFEPT